MADPTLLEILACCCPSADGQVVLAAVAGWLEKQEREPWLSPAYRITARLLREEASGNG